MAKIRWGIIGPGGIAHNFSNGLAQCESGVLSAIGSRSSERRQSFGDEFGVPENKRYASYEALVADPDIDAIYVSTPHPFHAELAILAMRAGKHVLCEKPAGLIAGEVITMVEIAAQEGVLFMEAFMYRCHPQIARAIEIIRSGEIGDVRHIHTTFGFAAKFDPKSRAFDRALAGGAILDVGCYPISLARLFAGVAVGQPFADPITLRGGGHMGPSGVDETAFSVLTFPHGITAECATAVTWNMQNQALITGTKGSLRILDPWVPGRNEGPSTTDLEIIADGETRRETRRETLGDERMLFAFEAEEVSRTILAGKQQGISPATSWADSIGNAKALDLWRAEVGYELPWEATGAVRILPKSLPKNLPTIPKIEIEGHDTQISSLILGCDNKNSLAEGALIWDAWVEAGGNAFDTAYIYGNGAHEKLLGHWLKSRGLCDSAQVVVKGAHSPYAFPQIIAAQLEISLARLQMNKAPIYILHRDNIDVPVGEFVEAVNVEIVAGRIGVWGGSNWTPERFAQAVDYALENALEPPRILNNNLSLATMIRPVWEGCISSNTPKTLEFLRQNNVAHFGWSSQARGFFIDPELRTELDVETTPDLCFDGADNRERLARAQKLSREKGVATHAIATAWVLAQTSTSFAIIGPRSVGELSSTLQGLIVKLSTDEAAWLNLET